MRGTVPFLLGCVVAVWCWSLRASRPSSRAAPVPKLKSLPRSLSVGVALRERLSGTILFLGTIGDPVSP